MTLEFAAGLGLGVAVAAPIGPMAMLCIGRAISGGFSAGLTTGLGAATVHGLFATLATQGLDRVQASHLAGSAPYLATAGGFFLLWFAVRLYRHAADPDHQTIRSRGSLLTNFGTACLLGFGNPMTLILFVSSAPIFLQRTAPLQALPFVLGVLAGSLAWWLALSLSFGLLRARLRPGGIGLINRGAAIALAGLGLSILATHAEDVLPALSTVSVADHFGFAGAAMTLIAFAQTHMVRMRLVALAANVFFIAFGLLAPAHPVLALHAVLLPLNLHHLAAAVPIGRVRLATLLRSSGSLP